MYIDEIGNRINRVIFSFKDGTRERTMWGNSHGVTVINMVYQIFHIHREMTEVYTCEIIVTIHTIIQITVEILE